MSSCVAVGEGRENGLLSPDESYPDRDEPRWLLEFSGIGMCIDAQLFKPMPIATAGAEQRDGWCTRQSVSPWTLLAATCNWSSVWIGIIVMMMISSFSKREEKNRMLFTVIISLTSVQSFL